MIWIEAGHLENVDENGKDQVYGDEYKLAWKKLKSADGIVVPGGFGNRYVTLRIHIFFVKMCFEVFN